MTVKIKTTERDGWLVPVLDGEPSVAISDLVYTCHEQTIDRALAKFNIPGLTRATLDGVLTYCAEQQCQQADATCPGCHRRCQVQGLTTFEDFIAAHKEIVIGNAGVRLTGTGSKTAHVTSLRQLERTWAGETYWYWARRILRKLRHGVRRAEVSGQAFAEEGASPVVILKEPQLADNVGMVARAMGNFGLDSLRLVNPRDGWPNDKARIAASGANYIIDHAKSFDSLDTAMADLNWVAATTARQRDLRKPVMTPLEAVKEMRRRIATGERCGVLFGRESSGLENADVANVDAVIMIPVNAAFASLNLAQATLIFGYEWLRGHEAATLGRVTKNEQALESGLRLGHDRPASKAELLQFFEHLEAELERLGFFQSPEKRPKIERRLRTMFTRMAATDQEVRILRGIVATLAAGKGKARKTSL